MEGAAIIRGVVSGGETKGRKKTGRAGSLEVSVARTGFRSPEQKVGGAGEGSGDLRCCPGLRGAWRQEGEATRKDRDRKGIPL